MKIKLECEFESIEEMNEFLNSGQQKKSKNIDVGIAKNATVKKIPKQKPQTPKTTNLVVFPNHTQKKYELKWAMAKYQEDWWNLRYRNGQGFRKFEGNLLQLCFLKTFKGKITEREFYKYAKQFDMSETRLRKIIWNLKEGTFDKYFQTVKKEVKNIKINILRDNTLLINNVETSMTVFDAKGLLISIQNAPNKPREILKQYKQFQHKIDMKQYFLLCWNYNNSELLDTIKFRGM